MRRRKYRCVSLASRIGLALALCLAGPCAVAAAVAPASTDGTTLLSLSDTASVAVTPDELTASLQASAAAPSAAAAQAMVNGTVAAALKAVRSVPGMHVETAGYTTWERPPGAAGAGTWQASQGLTLRAEDGPALLRLVGTLQQKGLVVGSLAWTLSEKARKAAHDQAMGKALRALRARAVEAARILGLQFARFRSVLLGAPPPLLPRPMLAAARVSAPLPSAVTEAITVEATASAEAVLVPMAKR